MVCDQIDAVGLARVRRRVCGAVRAERIVEALRRHEDALNDAANRLRQPERDETSLSLEEIQIGRTLGLIE